MAGFRKAAPQQAAVKMSLYGPPGSGKTFSTLLFAEGIARHTGKRIAFVDTERGTDFYAMPVQGREPHPEAFDFDALYTRSLTEALSACQSLDPKAYSVIVIDSISHLWDAAMAAYSGNKTGIGSIPMHAWAKIKAPYKALMKFVIDSPFHVFILGRQANVFEQDSESGESKNAGFKMRAEGETAYEPHVCLRMVPQRTEKKGKAVTVLREQVITAFAEKDRTGLLSGRSIAWPNFENVIAPMLGLMGTTQGAAPSDDEAAAQDAESIANAERERFARSAEQVRTFAARFELCKTEDELKKVGAEITPAVKKAMTTADVAKVRDAYLGRQLKLQGQGELTYAAIDGGETEGTPDALAERR